MYESRDLCSNYLFYFFIYYIEVNYLNTYTYYIAMTTNRIFRRLPTRHHITEIKFTGRQFSRERIAHEIERIREQIPNKQFQVLLPYEYWITGSPDYGLEMVKTYLYFPC